MKTFLYILFLSIFFLIEGCIPLEDDSKIISFWTDRVLSEEGYNMVFANDIHVGDFVSSLDNPSCSDTLLLNFKISNSDDLHLTVRNDKDEVIEIGVVNLFAVSSGIKIKPSEEGEIFVEHALDDVCTLVYLNWK